MDIKIITAFLLLPFVVGANIIPFGPKSHPILLGINPFTPQGRIVGGEPVPIEDHPWQVSLQVYGFHFCGGSIISDSVIMTAGHCTTSYPASYINVRVGSHKTSSGGAVHQVHEIIRHENYKSNMYGIPENDIAVLKLKTPIQLSKSAQPISLFEQNEEAIEGVAATISGWGTTRQGGSLPEVLHAVNVPIITKSTCNDAYVSYGGIPDGQICAAYPQGGKDSCQGDSGGPLVIGGRQAGIVSWGNGCAKKGWPGVYSEVAAFRDWIVKNVGI